MEKREFDKAGYIRYQGDRWRKCVIGAIAGYFRYKGYYQEKTYQERLEIIKDTACKVAGVDDINHIPLERLRAIYNEFKRKQD